MSLRNVGICHPSGPRTFFVHRTAYLQAAIINQWKVDQTELINKIKQAGKPVTLAGDMRAAGWCMLIF